MRLVEAECEAVWHVAHHVREQDDLEARLGWGMAGNHAVIVSWAASDLCVVIEGDDGNPIGVTGLDGTTIWMLGTEELTATRSHRRQLCSLGRRWVAHCLERVNMPIGNHAYAKNRRTLRWLKHLGFQVEAPVRFGPNNQPFCPFWRTP